VLKLADVRKDPASAWATVVEEVRRHGGVTGAYERWARDDRPILGTTWPAPEYHDLLRAAAAEETESAAAWQRWRANAYLRDSQQACYQVIPRAYLRSRRRGTRDRERDRFEGALRHTWTSNAVATRTLQRACDDLSVVPLLLKGAAVSRLVDQGGWLQRPACDVDVLIPTDALPLALASLRAKGWSAIGGLSDLFLMQGLASRIHSLSFSPPGKFSTQIDLHWHASALDPTCVGDQPLWQRSTNDKVGGTDVRVPARVDCLEHVCLHGVRWAPTAHIVWAADAALLLDRGNECIDPAALARRAADRGTTVVLWDALSFLGEILGMQSAWPLVAALEQNDVSAAELVEHQVIGRPPADASADCRDVAEHVVAERKSADRESRKFDALRALVPRQANAAETVQVPAQVLPLCPLDSSVEFGQRALGASMLVRGWSIPEQGWVWSEEARATLAMRVPVAPRPLQVAVTIEGASRAPGTASRLQVSCNGSAVAERQLVSGAQETFTFSVSGDHEGKVVVDLDVDSLERPCDLRGDLLDTRPLGFCLKSLVLSAAVVAPRRTFAARRQW